MRKYGKETVEKIFYRSSRYLSFTIIPVTIFLISISRFLLQIYGKGKYLSGIPVLIIFTISTIFSSFYSLFMTTVFSLGRPIETTKIELVKSIINIGGCLLVIKLLGISGIAIIGLISTIAGLFMGYLIIRKFIFPKIDLEIFKKVLLISIFCGIIIGVPQFLFYSLKTVIISTLIGIIIFIFTIKNAISADDKELLKSIIKRI